MDYSLFLNIVIYLVILFLVGIAIKVFLDTIIIVKSAKQSKLELLDKIDKATAFKGRLSSKLSLTDTFCKTLSLKLFKIINELILSYKSNV